MDPMCEYVLPKKKRRCKMLVKRGNRFCGEHSIHDENNTDRVVCPNDGKHTILKSELEMHLKKCNSRIIEAEYIKVDANSIRGETKFTDKIDRRATEEEIREVVHKIWKCYETDVKERLIIEQKTNELVEKNIKENPDLGETKKKHLVQISSILGHIESAGVLPTTSTSCMFELGAGKGQLAYWISKAAPNGRFILMDRSGSRNKFDNAALRERPELVMKRYRCSIEHMDLSKIEELKNSTEILAVCKHFCGSATDAGIRSLMNSGLQFNAALLVPCCHHKSRFAEYGGHEFLKKWEMSDEASFSALRYLASFATNGAPETEVSEGWKSIHSPLELGRRAKAILEIGRAIWLESVGFETKVIEYVPPEVSPENLLILALKRVC
uniref:tRNA:m(4)X modification enzyme TRM13 n=2 Tax=Caenorhabditis tropicalis TaxID=1561998 RepID=A0A1I7UW03_9PELO